MIKLTDFLIACKVPLNLLSYKVHLATGSDWLPLDAFYDGKFKEWQENQNGKNFSRDMVVGLIHVEGSRGLFAGVYRVLGFNPQEGKRVRYSTELLAGQDDLIGRVIVEHKRSGRAAYLIGKPDGGPFHVCEIRPQPMTIQDFPGYQEVCVSYAKLKIIIEQNLDTWRGALSNMKGVYIITDLKTGRLYVGSATGSDGLWQRWGSYVKTGHGGNKDLKRVLKDKGPRYVEHFQYSLLEVADSRTSDEYVLERESFWKEVLASRKFGYNAN
ncbi:MAG: GIY-YIG nuclease family protein [Bacteroidales bacterium]|nr:GIY-YIG nuclease family protein [Candidatus Latescibacterota bacterium]